MVRKNIIFIAFTLILTSSIGVKAASVRVDVDNLRYTVDTEAQTAELYGPVSSSTVFNNLVIPDFIEYGGLQIPVTSIRNQAFFSNKNLKGSLTIGDNVQTIGNSAFYSCSSFTGFLTIGDDVQTIGNSAFYSCSGFTGSLTIGDDVQTIGNSAFYSCSGFTGSLTIGDNVQTIGDHAFFSCSGFTGSLTIGDNVQTIGEWAFYGCSGFTGSLTIGDNVQTIGEWAFYNCKSFTGSLTIGDNVQTIGNDAFYNCSGFTGELIIPESVKEIGKECFAGCVNLTSLTVTSSETVIYYMAFQCLGLESITCLGITPPTCVYIKGSTYVDYIFEWPIYDKPLYVPAESVNLYKNATEWKKFKSINPIQVEATGISLNKNDLNLLIGQEETLIATLTPEDATTEVIWSVVDDNPIISVDQSGKVKALAVGEATVKVTAGDVSATCKVTVNPILATSISIDGGNINTLKQTETLQLTATIIPDNTTYHDIIWKSSDESKATVSNSGLVTAIEEGDVEITATLSYQPQITASYNLTIQKRLLGDANDNGVVNVADVGTISDYIVNKPVYNFCFVNADVITDGRITTADVTATVDIIFNDTPSLAKYAKANTKSTDGNNELIIDNFTPAAYSIIDVNLKYPYEFTGLQGSIIIPKGMTIENVTKGRGASNHILNYNITDQGTIEFILYSLKNATFDDTGSLIELEIRADRNSNDFIVNNILASDESANEYTLSFTGGKNNELITSLDMLDNSDIRIYSDSEGIVVANAQGESVNIFNMAGERIISAEARSNKDYYPLSKGIYIVTVKSETAKLIVK